jgi:hypothetical protein
MPVDTSIYQMEPARSVLDFQNEYRQADLHAQQLQQNKLALMATQQATGDEQAYRAAFAASGGDTNKLLSTLQSQGLHKPYQALREAEQKRLKGEAEIGHIGAQTTQALASGQKSLSDVQVARAKQYQDQLSGVNTTEDAKRWITAQYQDPHLSTFVQSLGGPLEEAVKRIPTDPAAFNEWRQRAALGMSEYTKLNKPTITTRNLGGSTDTITTEGLTGATRTVNSAANTQSPDNAATNATSRANNQATVGASYAHAAATRDVAQATRDAANIQTGFTNEQNLRKEFEGLPEVKNYKQAFPAYAAIKDAAGRNSTQADINIVYGLAKLYDPNSVVREGEYATVANSPNIPEKVKGYAQYLAGGGKLSPGTKAAILTEAQGRIGTYETEARKAKGSYEGIARKRGMDPANVFADMGNMAPGAAPAPAPAGKVVNFGDLK